MAVPALVFVASAVIVSSPRHTGEQIKTDRRDATRLAEYVGAGLLTACFVPDPSWESARNLVRSHVDLVATLHRPNVRAHALLRSRGQVYRNGRPWTQQFMTWLSGVTLAHANDAHVLRGHWAQIGFLPAQLRDVEHEIAKTAARSRFREGVEILQSFRGITPHTAMLQSLE